MPTSRRRQWVWVSKDAHSELRKHLPASKLEKGIVPTWTGRPEWTQDPPTGEWGMKCVDRWCLLPPYNITITEEQWKAYYDERSALDKINTMGSAESKAVKGEYLEENTWKVLRKAAEHIASAILASALDDTEHQKSIARTLLGSLYFMSVEGSAECEGEPEPRSADTTTRLYSPFGLGTSTDFHYDYHYRRTHKRFWYIKLYALTELRDWDGLEQLAKSRRSPIGYEPFVTHLVAQGHLKQAASYVPRCDAPKRAELFVKCGEWRSAGGECKTRGDKAKLEEIRKRAPNNLVASVIMAF